MIPRSRQTSVDALEDKFTPETEQIEVTEVAFVFTDGHVLPLNIFPED